MNPCMLQLRNLPRPHPQTHSQRIRPNHLDHRSSQFIDIPRLNQQRRLSIDKHFANLAQPARNDPFPHRHVLKNLRRRTKELTAVRERHVRRNEYVASIQQPRHTIVTNRATKNHAPPANLTLKLLLDLRMQATTTDQQKSHRQIRRHQPDRRREFLHSVPWSKGPDKSGDNLVLSDRQLTPDFLAANTGPENFNIDTIRI